MNLGTLKTLSKSLVRKAKAADKASAAILSASGGAGLYGALSNGDKDQSFGQRASRGLGYAAAVLGLGAAGKNLYHIRKVYALKGKPFKHIEWGKALHDNMETLNKLNAKAGIENLNVIPIKGQGSFFVPKQPSIGKNGLPPNTLLLSQNATEAELAHELGHGIDFRKTPATNLEAIRMLFGRGRPGNILSTATTTAGAMMEFKDRNKDAKDISTGRQLLKTLLLVGGMGTSHYANAALKAREIAASKNALKLLRSIGARGDGANLEFLRQAYKTYDPLSLFNKL